MSGHPVVKIVNFLFDRGANVNMQDKEGYTALMLAAQNGHTNIVEILLSRGADPMIKNITNQTALDLCPDNRQDIKDILTQAMDAQESMSNFTGK